jgi:hypothetical protein
MTIEQRLIRLLRVVALLAGETDAPSWGSASIIFGLDPVEQTRPAHWRACVPGYRCSGDTIEGAVTELERKVREKLAGALSREQELLRLAVQIMGEKEGE